MLSTTITFAGNLADDPDVTFTAHKGTPVASFRVLVNRRVQDAGGEWVDAQPTAHSCKLYGPAAENVLESLRRGDRVIVHGEVRTETWDDKESGEKRYQQLVIVEEMGASMKWASLSITKTTRAQGAEETTG